MSLSIAIFVTYSVFVLWSLSPDLGCDNHRHGPPPPSQGPHPVFADEAISLSLSSITRARTKLALNMINETQRGANTRQ